MAQSELPVEIVIPAHAADNVRQQHIVCAAISGIERLFLLLTFGKTFGFPILPKRREAVNNFAQ